MPTITDPDDVKKAYQGDIPASQDEWLTGRIEAAERLIATRLLGPGHALQEWTNGDENRAAAVKDVVTAMVLRLVRAGTSGYLQTSETIGPTAYSTRADPRASSSTLWVTEDEWMTLGITRHSIGTMRTPPRW